MDNQVDINRVKRDYKFACDKYKNYIQEAEEDFRFFLGDQWDKEIVDSLADKGVRALTINLIWPQIILLSGIESQNRTDFRAFPEGREDSVEAEIATRLLKNVMKNSDGNMVLADVFRDGIVCGFSAIEGYVDYDNSEDMLTGDLKWGKNNYYEIKFDPNSKSYDHSDARYVTKTTFSLSKDQLISLYPKKRKKIEKMESGIISKEWFGSFDSTGAHVQHSDYPTRGSALSETEDKTFDLLEYYYKKNESVYYVIDYKLGKHIKAESYEDALNYYEAAAKINPNDPQVDIVERMQTAIYLYAITGGMEEPLYHGPAPTYPTWKLYPVIPFYVHRTTTKVSAGNAALLIQGQVRQLKDLQRELNKRRTQELHILNTSANSGFIVEEDALVDEESVKKFGSSAGVVIKYKAGKRPPEKIMPTPLSQGHAQLAAENKQDIKETSGVNTDLLAMQEGGSDSGRAIALRQKQGLVMVQKAFDNFSFTKKLVGRFILSQLSNIFTVEKAMRALGDSFIAENFQSPVIDPRSGQPLIDPQTMSPMMQMDVNKAAEQINKVLTDPELYKYDVEVGQGVENETIKYANYLMLLEMAKQGIPIPPEVIIDESNLPASSKQKIMNAIQSAQAAQAAAQKSSGGKK